MEEFQAGDSSVGYDQAKAGETFVRIGVGAVRKPQEPAYRRFATYEIVDPGTWKVARGKDNITFIHELRDANGYGYVYTKVLRLAKDTLVLDHRLKNTGRKAIETSVYNHNFFTIDRQPTGPDIVVRLGFDPRALRPLGDLGSLDGQGVDLRPRAAREGPDGVHRARLVSARPRPTTTSAWRTARHARACASRRIGRS